MNMESNFDDTMFEVDEFDETPTPSNLETDPKPEKTDNQETDSTPPSEGDQEDDLTTEVLRLRGISNPDKIKFEDESGAVTERSWDSLTKEEQINILADQREHQETNNELAEDEIDLINAIRNSGMSVQDYMQTITPQINQPQDTNQFDAMSDEDLYAFDILNKVGNDNITDEELDAALEAAKANETLFKKTVDGLRQQYNRLQEEQKQNIANQQQAAAQQRYQAFANVVNNQIDNFNSFAGQPIQLSNQDKDNLSEFMLALDEDGSSALGKALQDPKLLTKAAFWLLNEQELIAELQKQQQDAYTRGYNAGKGDILNKSKFVFKPTKQTRRGSYSSPPPHSTQRCFTCHCYWAWAF